MYIHSVPNLKGVLYLNIPAFISTFVSDICPPQASLSAGHGSRSTLDREFEKEFSRLDSDISFSSGVIARSPLSDLEHDLKFSSLVPSTRSPLNTAGHSASSSKTEKCSSSVSSTNGSWPHRYLSCAGD